MRFSEADGLRVGLWGAGRETAAFARAASRRLPRCEIAVVATDRPATPQERSLIPAEGVSFVSGPETVAALAGCQLVIRSPGISVHRPEARALRDRGVPVTTATSLWLGECVDRSIVGVTGTKGKSTTASLIAHLLRRSGATVELAGNVGRPALDLLDAPAPDCYVIELSSYQIADLAHGPRTAVFTNLYREHVDWHGSHDVYVADKLRLAALPEVETLVINAEDERLRKLLASPKATLAFGAAPGYEVSREGIARDGAVVLAWDKFQLVGRHNLLNLCAALTALEALGVSGLDVAEALQGFRSLPHRLEQIADVGGTIWVDDSISTTPESTLAAVRSFPDRPLVLIAGGFDRQQDYTELGRVLAGRVTAVIGLPDTGPRLVEAVRASGASDCHTCEADGLEEAVALARQHVPDGGVVLLSPGAPSFGAYANFEERGDHFRSLVRATAR